MSLEEDQVRSLGYGLAYVGDLEDSVRKELKLFSVDEYLRGINFVEKNGVMRGIWPARLFMLNFPHSERYLREEFELYLPYGIPTEDVSQAMDNNFWSRSFPEAHSETIRKLGVDSFWQGYKIMKNVVKGKEKLNRDKLEELLTEYCKR